jgi:hypothetical protein
MFMANTVAMLEKNDLLSPDDEVFSRYSDIQPASQTPVTLLADVPTDLKAYPFPQVYKLRLEQSKTMDLSQLTSVQWGIVEIDKCHHISTTITAKDAPPSYRVRVCKTCCKQDNHIELGTYVDQESAVLINDVHEILQERFDKLIVLTKEDKPYLHLLLAKKYDRQCGRDHTSIMKILLERARPRDEKRKRKRVMDLSAVDESTVTGSKVSSSSPYGSHDSASTSQQGDESSSASGKLSNLDGYESEDNHPIITHRVSSHLHQQASDATTDTLTDSPMQLASPLIHSSSALDAVAAAVAIESAAAALATVSKTDAMDFSSSPGRPRAATFSARSLSPSAKVEHFLSPMSTLTWLATMKDDELDAARLLSELGCGSEGQGISIMGNHGKKNVSYYEVVDEDHSGADAHDEHGRRARSLSLPYLSENVVGYPYSSASSHHHSMRPRANSFASDMLAITHEIGFIGIYSPEERKKRILRFLEKRKRRIWTKKVKYDVRKVRAQFVPCPCYLAWLITAIPRTSPTVVSV